MSLIIEEKLRQKNLRILRYLRANKYLPLMSLIIEEKLRQKNLCSSVVSAGKIISPADIANHRREIATSIIRKSY